MATLAHVFKWSATPGYWESFRYTFGTYTAAARQMKISPELLRKAAHARRGWEPGDKEAKALQKALGHVGERKRAVAEKFAGKARAHFTTYQLQNAAKSSKRSRKGREYFMEQVEKYRVNRPPRYQFRPMTPGETAAKTRSPRKGSTKRLKVTRHGEMARREKENGKRAKGDVKAQKARYRRLTHGFRKQIARERRQALSAYKREGRARIVHRKASNLHRTRRRRDH